MYVCYSYFVINYYNSGITTVSKIISIFNINYSKYTKHANIHTIYCCHDQINFILGCHTHLWPRLVLGLPWLSHTPLVLFGEGTAHVWTHPGRLLLPKPQTDLVLPREATESQPCQPLQVPFWCSSCPRGGLVRRIWGHGHNDSLYQCCHGSILLSHNVEISTTWALWVHTQAHIKPHVVYL